MANGAKKTAASSDVACPLCAGSISLPAGTEEGEIITCDECSAELEVKTVEPTVTLGEAPKVQEDWGE